MARSKSLPGACCTRGIPDPCSLPALCSQCTRSALGFPVRRCPRCPCPRPAGWSSGRVVEWSSGGRRRGGKKDSKQLRMKSQAPRPISAHSVRKNFTKKIESSPRRQLRESAEPNRCQLTPLTSSPSITLLSRLVSILSAAMCSYGDFVLSFSPCWKMTLTHLCRSGFANRPRPPTRFPQIPSLSPLFAFSFFTLYQPPLPTLIPHPSPSLQA